MRRFLENWNYKKHAAAVSGIYLGIALIGNAFLGKKIPKDEKSLHPAAICRNMTIRQRIFNGVLADLYCFDMSVTYGVINHFKKQFK